MLKKEYILWGILVPLVVATAALFAATALGRRMTKKGYGRFAAFVPLLVWALPVFYILLGCFQGFRYPISVAIHAREPLYRTVGQVSQKSPGPILPIYFTDGIGKPSCGTFIVVENDTYFLPNTADFELGQWVSLDFEPSERVVLHCQVLSPEEGMALQVMDAEIIPNDPKPVQKTVALRAQIGRWMWYACFIVFAGFVVGGIICKDKLGVFLQQYDHCSRSGVHASKLGRIWTSGQILLFLGMIIGQFLNGATEILVGGGIAAVPILCVITIKQTTHIEIENDCLVYRMLGKRHVYDINQVSASWQWKGLEEIRCLVIQFPDRPCICLEQIYYQGLHDTYQQMKS